MRTSSIAAALVLIASAVAASRSKRVQSDGFATVFSDFASEIRGVVMPTDIDMGNANLRAFLMMIRYAEGTQGDDGYRALFGWHPTRNPGQVFGSFADHPRVLVPFGSTNTTAAGAYQILAGTWDEYRAGLPDFSPASQDICAARLIRRRGALNDVYEGRFADAVRKCGREWASLPGSPYGQPVRTLAQVVAAYRSAGGAIA